MNRIENKDSTESKHLNKKTVNKSALAREMGISRGSLYY